MKIVRVYKSVKSGGGVHHRLQELLPLLARQAEVRVLCYRERGDRADAFEAAGIPVDVIPLGSKWAPWNVARYVAYFRRHAPQLVHTHEYTANTLMVAAARRAGVPVRVRHLHTLAPWGWHTGLRHRLRLRADRAAARQAHCTLAVSGAVRDLYLEQTGLPPESCRVLYNGLDLARFDAARGAGAELRAQWGISESAPLVGMVGRISRGKGHGAFLEAAAAIAARLPGTRFVVVGDGSGRDALEGRVRELGLMGRVHLAGYRGDVPACLDALDLFLFPSEPAAGGRVQDGLPGTVIEAQAAGLPVVAFALPMMDELVDDGATGRLVPVGDAAALAEVAVELLQDGAARRAIGEGARHGAQRFSLERCADATRALYDELLEREGVR